MTGDTIVMLATVAAALTLAIRGFRSRGMSFNRTATMAVVWIAIIAVVAFVLQRFMP